MHEGRKNCERENNGLRGKIKGTRTKEENKRLRGEIKGVDSVKGQMKSMSVKIKCVMGGRNKGLRG